MLEILKRRLITNFPEKIFYLYKIHQAFMSSWNLDKNNPQIEFIQGLDLTHVKANGGNCVLVIDDLVLERQRETAEIFIYGSHHMNISTFFLTQNLFVKDECFRLMSLNAAYFVLFANIRSMRQIKTLAQQTFTGKDVDRVMNAYKRAGEKPFGFILLSFVQNFPKELVVCTNFWDEHPSFFL